MKRIQISNNASAKRELKFFDIPRWKLDSLSPFLKIILLNKEQAVGLKQLYASAKRDLKLLIYWPEREHLGTV